MIVMKFGGTSVEDAYAIRRLVRIVRSRLNFRVVVVVSALAKVTDELLRLGPARAPAHAVGEHVQAAELLGDAG